jgi:hypothetical protein
MSVKTCNVFEDSEDDAVDIDESILLVQYAESVVVIGGENPDTRAE